MRTLLVFALVSGSALVACTPYDPDLGAAPFLCGPPAQEPRCPSGYKCTPPMSGSGGAEVCLSEGGVVPPDAGNTNCADDSPLEPNNSITNAWQTPVDTTKMFPLAGLAICPSGDKDTYSVTIRTANENLEMVVEYHSMGAVLQGAILNSGGIAIGPATAVSGAANKIRAYTPNLPTGVYYVQVYAPTTGLTTNNYKLDINV